VTQLVEVNNSCRWYLWTDSWSSPVLL